MEDGSYRPISRVLIGDRVLVYDLNGLTTSSVLAILSHQHVPLIDFIDLYTSESTLRLTPEHFLLVRKQNQLENIYAKAEDISVGDFVYFSSSPSNLTFTRIIQIGRQTRQNEDAYTLLTLEGTIVTNNLVASCYATYSPSIMHVISKPVQWWFWLLVKFEFDQLAEWNSLLLTRILEFYSYTVNQWHEAIFHLSTQMNAVWYKTWTFS